MGKNILKRLLSISCIVLITLTTFSFNSYVLSETLKYVVITPKVNVRNTPSLDAEIIYIIEDKGEFLITRETNDITGKLWYKIIIKEGLEGFVASWVIDRINIVETETPVKGKIAIINAGVRIRINPSTDSEIKKVVNERIEKTIIAEIKDSNGQFWYKINLDDGSSGWVASWVVEIKTEVGEKKTASTKLIIIEPIVNLRKGPSLKYDLVASVTSHLETRGIYESLDENGKVWYMVKLPNGVEGWVASWVVSVKEYSEDKTPVTGIIAVIEPIVNVRKTPSTEGEIITVINKRGEFQIINQANDVNGKIWYEIKLSNGTGWVASWVIEVKNVQGGAETKDSVNVRKGPSTNYEKAFEIKANSSVSILGSAYTSSKEYWFAIQFQNKNGWVLSSLISETFKTELVKIDKIGLIFTLPQNINIDVYDGPDKNHNRKGSIDSKFGSIQIVGVAQNHNKESWFQIKSSKLEECWIDGGSISPFLNETQNDKFKITSISWAMKEKGTTLTIAFDSDGTYKFDTFMLDNPLRFVIDIKDTILFQKEYTEEINKEGILKVRATQFSVNPNIVRIVIDMGKNLKYVITKEKSKLLIELTDYLNYSGPKLFINGVEIENNLLLKSYNNTLYVPLYVFSNMVEGVLSWDSKNQEAVLLLFKTEYRLKPGTKYAFIKSSEHQSRIEINSSVEIFNDTLYVSIADCEKIFNISFINFDNLYYLDNFISNITLKDSSNSKILTIEYSLPIKYELKKDGNILNVISKNTILGSSTKFPESEILTKIISNKRKPDRQSECTIKIDLTKYPRYEEAVLFDKHQLVLTFKTGDEKGIKGKLIIVDPGHGAFSEDGYYDVGAIGPTGLLESMTNLKIALKLRDLLEKEGAKVILTREKEQDRNSLTLEKRVETANKSGADLFISIHQNASTDQKANGTEAYYFNDNSKNLADYLLNSLCAKLGLISRGTKQRGFAVTKDITTMPSVLVECAFISNPEEEKMLQSDNFINLIADGLLSGIKKFFES